MKTIIKEQADRILQSNNADKCFITADGNIFLNENRAQAHAKTNNLAIETYQRELQTSEPIESIVEPIEPKSETKEAKPSKKTINN